jgi:hypothetical protein
MSRFSYRECNPYTIDGHPDLTPQDLHFLGLTEHFYVQLESRSAGSQTASVGGNGQQS